MMKKCPVCGKPVNDALFSELGDEIYYFACPACKEQFDEHPDRYATAGSQHDRPHHGGHEHRR